MTTRCFPPLPPASLRPDGTTPPAPFPEQKLTTLIVDSRDRDFTKYSSSSQFVVQLPSTVRNVRAAVLVDAQIPASFYVVSAARGTSSLTASVGATTATVSVPDGNYTASGLASALQTALNAAFGASTFAVTFDATAHKFTLAASGVVGVDTTGAPAGVYAGWGLGYFLGFPRDAVTAGAGGVTSTFVANVNPETFLCVHIEELDNIEQCAIFGRGASGRRCFAKVPLSGDSYSYTMFDRNVTYSTTRAQADVSKLSVSLRFHDDSLVDLNGAEWSFALMLSCTEAR